MSERKDIKVTLVQTVPADKEVAAVVVRTENTLGPVSIKEIELSIKAKFGNDVLMVILQGEEEVEFLDNRAMNLRGWVRLPGTGVHEGNTSTRKRESLDS